MYTCGVYKLPNKWDRTEQSDLNYVPGILNIYLAYFHCRQQSMIPMLACISLIFFIGL